MIAQADLFQPKLADAVVLCVDDDMAILDVVKSILERRGFSVLTATNWRHALDTFKSNSIDLVMLDYEMPDVKGHEVALWIRRLNPDVPIILHSGSPDIPQSAKRVADAFVRKGAETYVLVAAISNLIMKSRVNGVRPGGRS
jgi:two-component system OmpR family response regulator